MRQITVNIPDFATMEDDKVARHPLSTFRDGRWSALSRYLRTKFETDRLNLYEAWAKTSLAWHCPACRREKADIARKTASGVVLCQLERHHDHLGDLAARILRETACQDVPDQLLRQRKLACVAVLPLVERFAETLVCLDCNAADAAMKKDLGSCAHHSFSFSPSEIGQFVVARPNAPHERDVERGKQIWIKADAEFRERLGFVETIASRLRHGLHDREQHNSSHNMGGDEDARMFLSLARHQLGARGNLPQLGEALRARSCANDGHRSAQAKVAAPQVRIPSKQEFANHDRAMQKPGPWSRAGEDWRCACCSRSKFQILRMSGNSKWTGHIHEISDYEEETDERALGFRSIHRSERPIFRSSRRLTICQDCRLVATDAGKLRADGRGGENCLPPDAITLLAGTPIPHRRHDVGDDQLRDAIERNRQWSDAADDFWTHRAHATEVWSSLTQYTDGRGLPFASARSHAIADLIESGNLAGWNAEECFDWLLEERRRLDR